MENEFVCSVEKENKLGVYRIHTIWEKDKILLNVAAKDASWTGEMSKEKVNELSTQREMTPDEYLNECKEVLTTNDGKSGVVYAVENGSFVWKEVVDEDTGIKVKLGAVPLQPTNFVETIQKMMNVALFTNKNLLQKIAQNKDEKALADSNLNNLLIKLEECEKSKIRMENELMSQFLAILNAKKSKISELEQERIKAKSSYSEKKSSKRKNANVEHNMIVDAYGEDTDDDTSSSSSPIKKRVGKAGSNEMTNTMTSIGRSDCCSEVNTDVESSGKDRPCGTPLVEYIEISGKESTESVLKDNICKSEFDEPSHFNATIDSKNEKKLSNSSQLPSKPQDLLSFFFGGEDNTEHAGQSMVSP